MRVSIKQAITILIFVIMLVGIVLTGCYGGDPLYGDTDVVSVDTDITGEKLDNVWDSNGILVRTGVATYDVIVDNSANWDEAYDRGDATGRSATYVVAASDAPAHVKAQADLTVDATGWETDVQTAITTNAGGVIAFFGTFTKDTIAGLSVPSNTHLVINGTFTFATDVGDGATLFVNSDTSSGNTNIMIDGSGILDGNKTNQSVGEQVAVTLTNCSMCKVDILIQNFRGKNFNNTGALSYSNKLINRAYPDANKIDSIENIIFQNFPHFEIDDLTTGWATKYGSVTYDSDDYISAGTSLKGTAAASESEPLRIYKTISATNLTDCNIGFYIKIDTDEVTNMYVAIYDAAGKYRQWRFTNSPNFGLTGNVYTYQIINWRNFYNDNGLDSTAVTKIEFRFFGGADYIVHIDNLSALPIQDMFPNGAVILTFDGPYERQFTVANPKMEEYGYKGVLGTALDGGDSDFRDPAIFGKLYQQGWDIVVYGRMFDESAPAEHLSEAEVLDFALTQQQWLRDNGLIRGSQFLQCNRHLLDAYCYDLLSDYFYFLKGYHFTSADIFNAPFFNIYGGSKANLAAAEASLDTAIANKGVYVFFYHLKDGDVWTDANFNDWIDYIHTSGVEVITYSQLLERYKSFQTRTIAPGEVRTVSGSLTGGAQNAILFAWHNPEAQDIIIKKVVINITTLDADAANIDCGIADDATYTNGGTEFFDDLAGETAQLNDSWVAGDGGTQTKWVVCQDSASATDGWVVAKILDADGTSIVGSYYIEYVGK